jgi:predicted molibdopterin-dependent oxidoreductase YjgC
VDPLRDFPDAALAQTALENVPFVVVQSLELGTLEPYADAFLPAAAFLEKSGHVTTWEGRGQRLNPIRDPIGLSLPDWEIFAALAAAAGADLGFATLDELHAEMGSLLAPRAVGAQPASSQDAAGSPAGSPEGMRLFSYPQLVDDGRLSRGAEQLKAVLQDPPFVEIHPQDAETLGLVDGAEAKLETPAGSAVLMVRVSTGVCQGAVFIPFNQPGLAANTLLSGSLATTVTLAAASEVAEPAGSQT